MISHPLILGSPPLWRGQGWLLQAAGDSQAGGDGGQDGRYCLNDEFRGFLLHGSFFLRLIHFLFEEGGRRREEGEYY